MGKRIVVAAAVFAACSTLASVGALPAAAATPTISVSQTSGLLNGQLVSVTGTGFTPGVIADVVECSDVPGQPTVSLDGFTVAVSCNSPLNGSGYPFNNAAVPLVPSDGTVDTSLVVHTGVIGPPTLGIDSAGQNSAADAALYPCPPTSAQQAAGASCELTLGDSAGDSASVPISFGAPISTSPSVSVSPPGRLSNGEDVTVNGTGFTADSPWLALECNLTPGEPTGAQGAPNLPIGCDQSSAVPTGAGEGLGGPASLTSYVTDPSGAMSTTLVIAEGNLGGSKQSSTYPCPPSPANVAAGGACAVLVEDAAGEQARFTIGLTGPVPVPTITVSPSTGLVGGEAVQISAENFAPNQTAGVLECNDAPGQPTISYDGIQVPVSCSSPSLVGTSSTGSFSVSFRIVEGVTGPPTEGTDSAGVSAETDAAAYPCPPTPAQQADGTTCDISSGDLVGDVAQAQIAFTALPLSCTAASGNFAFLCALYEDLLDRVADAGGLVYWEAKISGGASRSQVAYGIATSPECRTDLVEDYYEEFLGRTADPGGLSFWLAKLSSGASDQSVIEGILASAEFYSNSGGTPSGFVIALYEDLLDTYPDPGGLSYWEAQLAGGASRGAVAGGIISSVEYQTDFVESQYATLLRRPADPAGLTHWVAEMASGASYESVIAGIAGSAEFYSDATS